MLLFVLEWIISCRRRALRSKPKIISLKVQPSYEVTAAPLPHTFRNVKCFGLLHCKSRTLDCTPRGTAFPAVRRLAPQRALLPVQQGGGRSATRSRAFKRPAPLRASAGGSAAKRAAPLPPSLMPSLLPEASGTTAADQSAPPRPATSERRPCCSPAGKAGEPRRGAERQRR